MLAKIVCGRRATEVVEEYRRKLVQSINTMGPAQPPWVHQKHKHRALFWPEPEPEPHNISCQFVMVCSQNFVAQWKCSENIFQQRNIYNIVTFYSIPMSTSYMVSGG